MEKIRKAVNVKNLVTGASVIMFIAVVCPLLLIAKYNYASCDDFSYGIRTHQIWQETHSVWECIKTAGAVAGKTYHTWQGSFSAIFLMALQPSIWNEQAYALTTYIIIGCLCISELVFAKVVMVDICQAEKRIATALGLVVLSMQIFWAPHPVEAFFWYNGSVYYALYYSFSLLLMSVILKCIYGEKKKIFWAVLAVFIAAFVGGGNLPNGLLMTEVSVITVILCRKHRKESLKYVLPSVVVLFVSFMLNVIAPGNANRQMSSVKTPALESVVRSIWEGSHLIVRWSTLPVLVVMAALLPLLWRSIREVKFKFRFPALVSAISAGLFSSQLTPVIYAQSNTGPGRLTNVIYFSYWLLMIGNLTYWLGWVQKKIDGAAIEKTFKKYIIPFWVLGVVTFCLSLPYYGYQQTSSFGAYYSLKNGDAAQYAREQKERSVSLADETVKEVGLKEFTVKPYVLFFDDIEEDPGNWKNYDTARYYEKEKVWLIRR